MKHSISLFFVFLILLIFRVSAQVDFLGVVSFEDVKIDQADDRIDIHMAVNLTEVNLRKQDLMILIPVLQQQTGENRIELEPILIAGKTRYKLLERELLLDNYKYGTTPSKYIKRENGQPQSIPIEISVPFEEWMREASLNFRQHITGCRNCPPCFTEYAINFRRKEPFVPVFHVTYITPEPEPVKRRSEKYQARLNFIVDKYDLLRDFGNNRQVLDEVDQIISGIKSDEALTVETVEVIGYASPEGNYDKNMILSKNRAYAFVNYLVSHHNFSESMIHIGWKGEDWEGLYEVVERSGIVYKDEVLHIINNTEQITLRKNKLENLRGGSVYRELLKEYYPPLRRNEYTISYIARAFELDEARKLIYSRPQHLSLNEMFLVANSYPKESNEFKEVFDIATRMFPDNEVARINCSAQEIESGQYEIGCKRVSEINRAEAWNNIGVAYAEQGEWATARAFFERAAATGLDVAKRNLDMLNRTEEAFKSK